MRERVVRLIGRGDYDKADFREGEKFVDGANDASVGIGLGCCGAGALQNSGEAQAGNSADYRSVEGAPGEAEADQADVECVACGWRGHRSKVLIATKRN